MVTETTVTLDDLSEPCDAIEDRNDWNDDGVVILPGLVPDELIDAYEEDWSEANGFRSILHDPAWSVGVLNADRPGGWPDCTPYMRHENLRNLVCCEQIASALHETIGEPAGVHLNLSGWVTTGRRWHQDTYLNPWHVGDYYAAVWIAFGDIHPDSGPFQYIPGSHRWHRLLRDRIAYHVDMTDPQWPKHTETFLTPLVEEILERGWVYCPVCRQTGETMNCEWCLANGIWPAEVKTYLPKRGDVLLWHPRLYHQGSPAKVEGAYRPALIAHYSGIRHRQDMPRAISYRGGWLFPIEGGPV